MAEETNLTNRKLVRDLMTVGVPANELCGLIAEIRKNGLGWPGCVSQHASACLNWQPMISIIELHSVRIEKQMTFWRLYYHLTWATKEREPLIQPEIEERLYGYTIRKAAELGVYVYAVNGWFDHMHMVVAIPPKIAVADVVKHLKGASSHDLNHEMNLEYQFQWQRGYGALTIGERHRAAAIEYVLKQKEHHQARMANAWLERADELDEGPLDVGIALDSVPAALREAPVVYDAPGEPPF